jgi:hypothetical protein
VESRLRDDLELPRGSDRHPSTSIMDLTFIRAFRTPVELAQSAKAAGLRALCMKPQNFATVQLAILTGKIVPDIDVFGSLACNLQVGGVNPIAVEAAIKYGARQIWLPTIDSTNHATVTGSVGQHGRGLTIKGGLSQYALNHPRIYLLDSEGQVPPGQREVIQLVADVDIILNLGHTSFAEMTAVIGQAKKQGAKRIVCDHLSS